MAGLQRAGSIFKQTAEGGGFVSFYLKPSIEHADLGMEMLEHKMYMDFFDAMQEGMRWALTKREPPLDLFTYFERVYHDQQQLMKQARARIPGQVRRRKCVWGLGLLTISAMRCVLLKPGGRPTAARAPTTSS